jgi:putative membrane protein
MYLAKRFSVRSYLLWTKREIGFLFLWALFVTSLYDIFRIYRLSVELVPIQLMEIIGTALAISLGFKNQECFARGREALVTWEHIHSASIVWAKKSLPCPAIRNPRKG